MSNWRERFQQGRFRDVPFLIEWSEKSGGRRTVVHEYPLRDVPFAEDLGREAREFTMDWFVFGENYMDGRDALVDALEKSGPGTLTHPYYGAMSVSVLSYRVHERTRDGGVARFFVQLVESGDNRQPESGLGTGALVDQKADTALGAVKGDFTERFSVDDKPEFVNMSAVDYLNDAASAVNKINGKIAAATSPINQASAAVKRFTDNLVTLVQQPANLVNDMVGLVSTIRDLPNTVEAAFGAYRDLFQFGASFSSIPRTTPERIQESDNQDAIARAMQLAAIIEAARLSALMRFNSRADAINIIDEMVGEIDTQATTARNDGKPISDPLYDALSALQSAMVRDINARSANLANLARYTPPGTMPALLISQTLFSSADQESDIVTRNNVRHPGFVVGGDSLEVLGRG